jgi:hypothetical protein
MEFDRKALETAYRHSIYNREEVLQSNFCSCFYCSRTFKSKEVVEWIDESSKIATAQCPFCGIDSVIGDKSGYPVTNKIFLEGLHSIYF